MIYYCINILSFSYSIARVTDEEGEIIKTKIVRNKTWHSDNNLKAEHINNQTSSCMKMCPKSRIKRRLVLLKGTSITVTKTKCKSYVIYGNYQLSDKRRWSL